jgi:mannose-1-phosphate guanylyltransferase
MAGGAGTRLWPLSTNDKPKQFLKLGGASIFSSGGVTVARDVADLENIFVATNVKYKDYVLEDFPDIQQDNLILEPAKKDWSAAALFAIEYISRIKNDPDGLVAFTWSDSVIQDIQSYSQMVSDSLEYARKYNKMIRFGMRAFEPNVNLGYAHPGEEVETDRLYKVDGYHEKPDFEKAKEFIAKGYLYNLAGFVAPIAVIIDYFKQFTPVNFALIQKLFDLGVANQLSQKQIDIYNQTEPISFEKTITEKVYQDMLVYVLKGGAYKKFAYYESLFDISDKDKNKNVVIGENIVLNDCFGNVVVRKDSSSKKLIVNDVQDSVVVITDDGMFVSSLNKSHRVKELL